jgi:Leucine-rich repeat (LRR) protein/preprotein translocase subunit SecG
VTCVGAGLVTPPRLLPAYVTVLDLGSNHIRSLEIAGMQSLTSLVNLKLTNNGLESIEDNTFDIMIKLQSLDLGSNRLRYATGRTLRARALQYLDLSDNLLESVDGVLNELTALERLDISNNQLTSVGPASFRNLVNLRYLILSGNRIRAIDKETFAPLERLMYLVLRGNDLEAPPLQLTFTSNVLSYVDLSECHLRTPPRGLPNSVRYLQLRRNNITSLHRKTFVDCPYVSILVLDENSIDHIDERTFDQMPFLQQLWLNANRLRAPPTSLPVSLQRLLLDANAISSLHNVFPVGSQLTTLSLMGNNVTSIAPGALRRLSRLQSLDLSDNNIRILRRNIFANNVQLQTLQLSKNPLKFLPAGCLAGLRSLTSLSLSYVPGPTYVSPNIFDDVTNLLRLDMDSSPALSGVLLNSGTMQRSLGRLSELGVQNCDATTLPSDLADWFTRLTTLRISSSLWYCDRQMRWFRDWLLTTHVTVDDKEAITCFEPRPLHQRPIMSLADADWASVTSPPATTSEPDVAIGDYVDSYDAQQDNVNYDEDSALDVFINAESDTAINSSLGALQTRYPYEDDFFTDNVFLRGRDKHEQQQVHAHSTLSPIVATQTPRTKYVTQSTLPWGQTRQRERGQQWTTIGLYRTTRDAGSASSSSTPAVDSAHRLGTALLAPPASAGDASGDSDVGGLARSPSIINKSSGSSSLSNTVVIIVIATTLLTVAVAVVLVIVIVCLVRKQSSEGGGASRMASRHSPASSTNGHVGNGNGNGALVHHQNGSVRFSKQREVLYFTPHATITSNGGHHVTYVTDSVHSDSLTDYTGEDAEDGTLPEGITLIPGRDINHEGPLRVYTWEEF